MLVNLIKSLYPYDYFYCFLIVENEKSEKYLCSLMNCDDLNYACVKIDDNIAARLMNETEISINVRQLMVNADKWFTFKLEKFNQVCFDMIEQHEIIPEEHLPTNEEIEF